MITTRQINKGNIMHLKNEVDKSKARQELAEFAASDNENGFSSISPMFIHRTTSHLTAHIPKGVIDDTSTIFKVKRLLNKLSLPEQRYVILAALYQISNARTMSLKLRIKESTLRSAVSRGLQIYIKNCKKIT